MLLPDIFTTQDLVRNPRLLLHRSGPAESQFLSYFQYKTLISLARGPFDGQVGCSVDDGTCIVYSPNMNHVWHLPIGKNQVMKICLDRHYADNDFLCWPQMYNKTQPHFPFILCRLQQAIQVPLMSCGGHRHLGWLSRPCLD